MKESISMKELHGIRVKHYENTKNKPVIEIIREINIRGDKVSKIINAIRNKSKNRK